MTLSCAGLTAEPLLSSSTVGVDTYIESSVAIRSTPSAVPAELQLSSSKDEAGSANAELALPLDPSALEPAWMLSEARLSEHAAGDSEAGFGSSKAPTPLPSARRTARAAMPALPMRPAARMGEALARSDGGRVGEICGEGRPARCFCNGPASASAAARARAAREDGAPRCEKRGSEARNEDSRRCPGPWCDWLSNAVLLLPPT